MASPLFSPHDGTQGNFQAATEARRDGLRQEVLDTVPELAIHQRLVDGILNAWMRGDRKLEVVYSDIDGVLLAGRGTPPEVQSSSRQALHELLAFLEQRGTLLIPNTGVTWSIDTALSPSILHRLENGEIPLYHHALATDGGSQLMACSSDGNYSRDERFAAHVRRSMEHFRGEQVLEDAWWLIQRINDNIFASVQRFTPLDFDRIRQVEEAAKGGKAEPASIGFRVFLQPHIHPDGRAHPERVSVYFYASNLDERDKIEQLFREQLSPRPIVCCVEEDFNNVRNSRFGQDYCATRYCLDVTPVHKGLPIMYLDSLVRRACDVLHTMEDGGAMSITNWYCGDAANDLVAARAPCIQCVCFVGGSSEELTRYRTELAALGKIVYTEHDPSKRHAASILNAFREVAAWQQQGH